MTESLLLKRNIWLVYTLTALTNAWFWVAIWVFYYLRFTDYAGIGFLESVMIITYVFGEIPTGAVADLLGKKYTMTVSYLLQAIGFALIGLAGSMTALSVGVITASLGGVLASGTVDALIYDSLLYLKEENRFEKVIGNIATIRMTALAAVSIVGGYLYEIMPGLPFLALSGFIGCAVVVSLFLKEPPIDSVVFSLRNYLHQTKKGFHELFKTPVIKRQSIILIVLSMIVGMNGHVFIDTQLYNQGWSASQLGYVATIMFTIAAVLSQLTPVVTRVFGRFRASIVTAFLIALSMITVPLFGMVLATFTILIRDGILQIFGNTASATINAATESNYRATTLSTYSMLSNIPYVLLAYFLGRMMDLWSVDGVVLILGIILGGAAIIFAYTLRNNLGKDPSHT